MFETGSSAAFPRINQWQNGLLILAATSSLLVTSTLCRAAEPQYVAPVSASERKQPITFINSWLLTGLFENDAQNSGYQRDFIGEAQVQPQQGQEAAGSKWTYFDDRLFSRNLDDYQDLFSYFKVRQGQSIASKVAYAHVYVYSPTPQNAQLRVGADNAFKAWVNGAQVAASTASSPTDFPPPTSYTEPDPEETRKNSGKDIVNTGIQLNAGWNRLLMKVANQENGRFGFYARLTNSEGKALPGLIYSTAGGSGPLSIATAAMPEAKTGDMPIGYREWCYVGAHPDLAKIQQIDLRDGSKLSPFSLNSGLLLNSSDFVFNAAGGAAAYRWYVVGGDLPPGLTLDIDGTLHGTIAASAKLGAYKFTVRVRDNKGATAEKEFTITVKERPNKWYEEARLGALIHGPENTPPADVDAMALLMKRQGYKLGLPISYNNGDQLFRWPAPMAKKKTPDDWVLRYKKALEAQGITFGMYIGNLNNQGTTDYTINQLTLVIEDAIVKYHPKAFWFDWLGIDATSADALYSMIKSYDPEIIIILNGHLRGSSGDWDILDYEGWQAWGQHSWNTWPADFPWPKKHAPESWRIPVQPEFVMSKGISTDWREMLRIQISLIGEGFIANIDHSPMLSGAPIPKRLQDSTLMQLHQKMADWASPAGKTPLYTSYTEVNPGPLNEAYWGYNTINLKRDTIYLHILKNPHGKKGMPPENTITVQPVGAKVKAVTWMNGDKPLTFSQRGTSTDPTVTINLTGVTADPIDTILKIELAKSLPAATEEAARPSIPAGNLASFKPAKLLSTDGTRALPPSGSQVARDGVDGVPGTTAAAGWEYAWTYEVDLQRVQAISRVVLRFAPAGFATEYKILVSDDGEVWQTVAEMKGVKDGSKPLTSNFAAAKARYVRIQAIKPDGPGQPGAQMSIDELEVYAK